MGKSVGQQWLQKLALMALVGGAAWAWHALGKAKDRIIMEPVRPVLATMSVRIDSVESKVDTLVVKQERSDKQKLRFQAAQMQSDPRLREYIGRMNSNSRSARARQQQDEEVLQNLANE